MNKDVYMAELTAKVIVDPGQETWRVKVSYMGANCYRVNASMEAEYNDAIYDNGTLPELKCDSIYEAMKTAEQWVRRHIT